MAVAVAVVGRSRSRSRDRLVCPMQMLSARSAINKALSLHNDLKEDVLEKLLRDDTSAKNNPPAITTKNTRVNIALGYAGTKSVKKRKKIVPLNNRERLQKQAKKKGRLGGQGGESAEGAGGQEGAQEEEIRHSVQTDPLAGKVREPLSESECGGLNAW